MKTIFVLLLYLGLVGCATMSQVTAPNRENILKLSIGMDKADVINAMGTEPKTAYFRKGYYNEQYKRVIITNPYRSEILQGKNKTLEVVYYVTDVKNDDGAITDDELTPLIFDDGKLIGWGWSFLENNVQRYELRIR